MKNLIIGVIDYDVGNHSSIAQSFKSIGYKCKVSSNPEILTDVDLLVLPGVGAFPAAMKSLHSKGLISFLQDWVKINRPILGICLGMQLLAEDSLEYGHTRGLGFIPGHVVPLKTNTVHVGWNSIEVEKSNFISHSRQDLFYFNHSYKFITTSKFRISTTYFNEVVISSVRKDNLIGLQFHPEKSQSAGRRVLKNIIKALL